MSLVRFWGIALILHIGTAQAITINLLPDWDRFSSDMEYRRSFVKPLCSFVVSAILREVVKQGGASIQSANYFADFAPAVMEDVLVSVFMQEKDGTATVAKAVSVAARKVGYELDESGLKELAESGRLIYKSNNPSLAIEHGVRGGYNLLFKKRVADALGIQKIKLDPKPLLLHYKDDRYKRFIDDLIKSAPKHFAVNVIGEALVHGAAALYDYKVDGISLKESLRSRTEKVVLNTMAKSCRDIFYKSDAFDLLKEIRPSAKNHIQSDEDDDFLTEFGRRDFEQWKDETSESEFKSDTQNPKVKFYTLYTE